jgi:hypothetical protein
MWRTVVIGLKVCAVPLAIVALLAMGQTQMPNPKDVSGMPLPSPNVPAGSVSVRVVRGQWNNVADQSVEFDVDGRLSTVKTDAGGRAVLSGVRVGANLQASTVLDGTRLVTQAFTMGASGVQFVLAGDDPDAARREAEDRALASAPATRGMVVLGPESRVVAQMNDDLLHIFYVIEVLNTARTPVDIGGPVIIELPTGARGSTVMDGSSGQATANGPRITILGPFAPGSTVVQAAFEMPYDSGRVQLRQVWPVPLQQVSLLVVQTGELDVRSPQIETNRQVNDRGQELIVAGGPGLPAGGILEMEITGLPHHARWPRYLALSLAGLIASLGVWGAVVTKPRRRAA